MCIRDSSSNVAHLKASCGDEAIRAALRLAPGEAMLEADAAKGHEDAADRLQNLSLIHI